MIAAVISVVYMHYNSISQRELVNKELMKVIDNYMGGKGIQIAPPGIVQVSFNTESNQAAIYAKVKSGGNEYILAFANKQHGYENIYFNKLEAGYFWQVKHVAIDKRLYLVCYYVTGSGAFLRLFIYSYDGIGKMKEVFNTGEFFGGEVYVEDNKIYISGNDHKYKIAVHNGTFSLNEYKEKVKLPSDSGSHILSYIPQGKSLKVLFDGKEVKFQKKIEKTYDSEETIEIKLDEQIIYDDNIVGYPPHYLRILIDYRMFDFKKGFFTTVKPIKTGVTSINLSANYREWYYIKFKITE